MGVYPQRAAPPLRSLPKGADASADAEGDLLLLDCYQKSLVKL